VTGIVPAPGESSFGETDGGLSIDRRTVTVALGTALVRLQIAQEGRRCFQGSAFE